jgi:hypothetical protein
MLCAQDDNEIGFHKKFTKVEMPKIFNIKNMSSFVRKLTRFGFTRIHDKQTMNSDIFAHTYFQRGCYEKATQIKYGPPPPRSSAMPPPPASAVPAMVPSPSHPASSSAFAPARGATTIEGSSHATSRGLQLSSSNQTLPHRVSIGDNLEGMNYYLTSGSEYTSNDGTLLTTIETLLRQREALRKDADANALAIVRLLQEQERVRSTFESDPVTSQHRSTVVNTVSMPHHHLLLHRISHEQLLHLAQQNIRAVNNNYIDRMLK